MDELFDEKVKFIKGLLEPFGPFLEAPSFRHTESIGRCSIYSEVDAGTDDFEGLFVQSLMALGGNVPTVDNIDQCWRPEQDAESIQAFNTDLTRSNGKKKSSQKSSLTWT